MEEIPFTAVEGIRVGHAHDLEAATGCSVIICEDGATGGVDVRGGAPGTRETDLLRPENLIEKIHAVVLTGGSAFGLDASGGVMQYLEERGIGFNVGVTTVPIVCTGTPAPAGTPIALVVLLVTNGNVPWSMSSSAPFAPSNSRRLPACTLS